MPGDVHGRRHEQRQNEAVRQRDVDQRSAGHDRTTADEHEGEGADEFGDEMTPGLFHRGEGRGKGERVRVATVEGREEHTSKGTPKAPPSRSTLDPRPSTLAPRNSSILTRPFEHQRRVDPAEPE